MSGPATLPAAPAAPAGVVAVVPSITAARVDRLARTWGADLARRGVRVVVVANAASVADAEPPAGVEVVTSRRNDGFAASVNLAARHAGGWRWLLVLNDDLDPHPDVVTSMLDAVAAADRAGGGGEVVAFDPEAPRSLPGRRGVVAGLSLVGDLVTRVRGVGGRTPATPAGHDGASPRLPRGTYTSFSAVAISRGTWEEVGELEERLPFCYEDAEYTRRLERVTGRTPVRAALDLGHAHSASTKSHIDRVLPVVAFSAFRYLEASTGTRPARLLVAAALLARLPLVPAASAPTRRHGVGVARALAGVLRGRQPALPAFEEL